MQFLKLKKVFLAQILRSKRGDTSKDCDMEIIILILYDMEWG